MINKFVEEMSELMLAVHDYERRVTIASHALDLQKHSARTNPSTICYRSSSKVSKPASSASSRLLPRQQHLTQISRLREPLCVHRWSEESG